MPKRYYWLKLSQNYFNSSEIKVLKKMENGCEYIVLWQELLLSSLSYTDETQKRGLLVFKENIPWSQELMEDVFGFSREIIAGAMTMYKNLGMITITDSGEMWANDIEKLIGKESDSAERVRRHRAKIKLLESNVTCNVTCNDEDVTGNKKRNTELEKDIDIETEVEKEKDNKPETDDESVVDGFEVISKTYHDSGLSFQLFKIEHHCKIYGVDVVKECLKTFAEVDLDKINKSPEAYFIGMLKNYIPGIKITPKHVIVQQETEKKLNELREKGEEVKKNKLSPAELHELTKSITDKSDFLNGSDNKKDSMWDE